MLREVRKWNHKHLTTAEKAEKLGDKQNKNSYKYSRI